MVELPVVTLGCVALLLLASLAGLADLIIWDDIRPSHFGGGHAGPKPAPLGLKADDEPEPSVLVTGVAGFVGFSLAKRLLERGTKVVGVDNFNAYYDVQLKADRAHTLEQLGAQVLYIDVCDGPALNELIGREKISHVLHMAAQAGVRFSLQKPQTYAENNIECFLVLLNVLVEHPWVKLVFASSSSVLGSSGSTPLARITPGSRPTSVYAATKRSNEILARLFHSQHGIRMVGLRFFTVYGPWGRPDMAVFEFATKIYEGDELTPYDYPALARDFTYIDDIVDGVIAVMGTAFSFGLYNLGSASPARVTSLIGMLETELGKKSRIRKRPLPRSEAKSSWADITEATRDFGFKPKFSLRDGIHRTMLWWLEYRHVRALDRQRVAELKRQAKLGERLDDEELLAPSMQVLAELRRNHGQARAARLNREWAGFGKALDADRSRLITPLGSNPRIDDSGQKINLAEYNFWEGLVFPFHELRREAAAAPDALRTSCTADPNCVGYTTNGVLKRRVAARERWTRCETAGCGTFTAKGIDYCGKRVSDCGHGAECSYSAQPYTCVCKTGYSEVGAVCLKAADMFYYRQLRDHERKTCQQDNTTTRAT